MCVCKGRYCPAGVAPWPPVEWVGTRQGAATPANPRHGKTLSWLPARLRVWVYAGVRASLLACMRACFPACLFVCVFVFVFVCVCVSELPVLPGRGSSLVACGRGVGTRQGAATHANPHHGETLSRLPAWLCVRVCVVGLFVCFSVGWCFCFCLFVCVFVCLFCFAGFFVVFCLFGLFELERTLAWP